MHVDLKGLTVATAADLIRERKLSPVELVSASLSRIYDLNKKLNIYLTVMSESALEAAHRAELEIQQGGYRGPLHGIPMSVKDILYTRGVPTTAGEKRLSNFVPGYDATVVSRLKHAGAIIVGKAHPLYGEFFPNPEYGFSLNPWNLDRLAGYSSDGPAAAVAVGTDLASIGSDGGGSIRFPAACCGVVGLKPTFGRVSRYGATVFGTPNDYLGPLTRTSLDAALVLHSIAGYDPKDPFSASVKVPRYADRLNGEIKGVRLGIPNELFWDYLDLEVETSVRQVIKLLEDLGCDVRDISFPTIGKIGDCHTLLSWAETSAFYQPQLTDWPKEYPDILMQRVEKGAKISAIDYIHAAEVRRCFIEELDQGLSEVDLLLTPTTILPAPPIGQWDFRVGEKNWSIEDLASRMSRPFNLSGHPAISVPCGFTEEGLPLAFQLVGPRFGEALILKVADAYQRNTRWHLRRPCL